MIYIFGDSFAANKNKDSWTSKLNAKVFATNGASEYRIWKTYQTNKHLITNNDKVLFCHTSPYRVFLKNNSSLLSRLLPTHPYCDIIINDIISKKESKFIDILNTIWDEEYFTDTHQLLVNDLSTVPNSYHFTFLESDSIISFNDVWTFNKGNINHMTVAGNKETYTRITQWLD